MKMSTTCMFNIRQGPSELFREYLARLNEVTIRVVPPNQEMFVGVFQNDLKAGNFNEYLSQRPTSSLVEVVKWVECYIKGEGSNVEKKAWDVK